MIITDIDALTDMWNKDSKVDKTELTVELARIPELHSKYLKILSHHNLIIRKLNFSYNTLKKIKWEYYNGDLNNPDDLKLYGYEPIHKKILRQDLPMYIEADNELVQILFKKATSQEIVDACTAIMKELTNRTYQLGNMIKWELFIAGR